MSDRSSTVRRDVELPAPPEQVWDAITDPVRTAEWFGESLAVEPRTGGRVTVGNAPGTRRGTVEHADPPRRLTLRVWDVPHPAAGLRGSRIDFVLEPLGGGGTLLTVTETRMAAGTAVIGRSRIMAGSSVG